ncbi:hypothetical protein L9F63_005762 [Diploptera punctata]|uniref:Protein sleepless n=1 Tax=Diploptera punctata TaxID=6984 RepID=A0AAD7ZCJ1_DIPPU|nr:hypothetical protein L9F63_005762 [Diploptera punctata]
MATNNGICALVVILAVYIHTAQSLKCFSCNSNQESCTEPFNVTRAGKDRSVYQEAPGDMVCVKHVTKLGKFGVKYVERKYLTLEHAVQYCNLKENGKVFCNWCRNEDGCNSAPSLPKASINQIVFFGVLCVVTMCFSKL